MGKTTKNTDLAVATAIAALLALALAALVFAYTRRPAIGEPYYSVRIRPDFQYDTTFVRPLETRGGYVRYEFYEHGDTLECVCPTGVFNTAHTRYRDRHH